MPLTSLEAELRPIARERIANGRLPHVPQSRGWAGYGAGHVCALCDKPINRDEVEYEVEQRIHGHKQTVRFHRVCEAVWQIECARDECLKNETKTGPSGEPGSTSL